MTESRPPALNGVSERIDALEGHLAQLLARQRAATPVAPAEDAQDSPASVDEHGDSSASTDPRGRIVRPDLQFDEDNDPDGFDERFSAFTDATEVDERSRDWLLS